MSYKIQGRSYVVEYSPEKLNLTVTVGDKVWTWAKPDFKPAWCESSEITNGVSKGVKAVYTGIEDSNGITNSDLILVTSVMCNPTDDSLTFEMYAEKDAEISKIYWPSAFEFDLPQGQGYTILPQMQGVLIPSKWDKPMIMYNDGKIFDRDGYMAFWGQIDNGYGYCAVFETPFDAGYTTKHVPGGETLIAPYWRESLGKIGYKRKMRYYFTAGSDYNDLAKIYRRFLIERGKLVTLREKIIRNPNAAKLIGTPVVHDTIAVHISPDSDYYHKDSPEHNDYHNTFDSRIELLKQLKKNGVGRAYLHYDGWGAHGYDNLHPDPFPVHEAAGGAEGMKRLADAANELGYIFGIHDQYRDYYYDGENFSFDNAVLEADGGHHFCSIWYGGKHTLLCTDVARDYVRRNYNHFKELGINIQGSYLDVFSVVQLDQCYNEAHRMTREQCAAYRRECLDYLTFQGIIPSSEEVTDAIVPSLALCHHAPFAVTNFNGGEAVGISIPLFNLVHHDCIFVPWFGVNGKLGGWGIPAKDSAYLWGLLCGGTTYYSETETPENIERGKVTLKLHEKIALCEMTHHEFIDNNYRKHRGVYADGTIIEIDLDTQTYEIK